MLRTPIIANIDDDEAGRFAVTHTLRQAGYVVWEGSTAAEALKLARSEPDIMLLDVLLPDGNGLDACRAIKGDPKTAGITVIHMSAQRTAKSDKMHGLDGGADGYLIEPISAGELVATLKIYLRMRNTEAMQRFLAGASARLAESLDPQTCAHTITDTVVPFLADFCVVETCTAQGMQVAALGHRDPAQINAWRANLATMPAQGSMDDSNDIIADAGTISHDGQAAHVHHPEAAKVPAVLAPLSPSCWIRVPLRARHETLGALTLGLDSETCRYSRAEFECVCDLAQRAALSLSNAYLFERARSAEAARRTGEERLRAATVATGIGIFDFRPVTGELQWDARCRTLFGAAPTEPTHYDTWMGALHPADRPAAEARIKTSLNQPGLDYRDEYRTIGQFDGVERWLNVRGRVTFKGGHAVRFVGTVLDVTARKGLENAAKQRAKFEQQLIAIVSHDLRSPLQVIRLSTDMLLRSEKISEQYLRPVRRIAATVERMHRLIGELLDFTKARLGDGIPIVKRPVNVQALVRQAVDDMETTHAHRDFRLELAEVGRASLDADRVLQVLSNLLGNAVSHSPDSTPIQVTLTGSAQTITLALTNANIQAPIPADLLTVLFEPFKRGEVRESMRDKSMGLGLYIVDQIVRRHDGTLSVTSDEAIGTRFVLELPRAL